MLRHLKMEIKTMLTSFRIDNKMVLEKYKTIWTKIKDLKNIELNPLPVYDDRYIKNKIKIYSQVLNRTTGVGGWEWRGWGGGES